MSYTLTIPDMTRARAILILLIITACIAALAVYAYSSAPRKMTLVFLDVGQGDAIFIESPTGTQVLIDGGRDTTVLHKLSKVMRPWDRSIDLVIGTHPDADHIGGLDSVIERYKVQAVMDPGIGKDTQELSSFVSFAENEGALLYRAQEGDSVDLGGGVTLEIIAPVEPIPAGDVNAASIVIVLRYGNTSALLTGDAPSEVEQALVAKGIVPDVDILKAGHHGSKTSTSQALLSAAKPEVVIYSVGKNNRYGHPHEDVVKRVQGVGAVERRTDVEGSIWFVSNGEVWEDRGI